MSKINLFYNGQPRTFGDVLCPWVVGRLSGMELETSLYRPRLLTMGSNLELATPHDIVCGSGFRNPRYTRKMQGLKVNAVRGPMSRAILRSYNVYCPEIYGDVVYLMPRFFNPTIQRSGIGVIAQENDHWMIPWDKTIKISAPFLEVLNFILSCDVLITSSLYCLMVAEAYGIPAALRLNEYFLPMESLFKFADYYQGTEREPEVSYENNIPAVAAIAQHMPPPKINEQALFDAFWESINTLTSNNALTNNNANISTGPESTINAQRH